MCIICFKPAGEPLPSDDAIKHMFRTNPHGAGYALQGYLNGGKFNVMYKKGFMTVDDFIKSLKSEGDEEYLRKLNIAMHFRIKTSGETDQATTHPFTITGDFSKTRRLHGQGKPILFHNGIFPELGGVVDPKASDTQDYVVGVAAKYLKTPYPNKIGQTIAQIVAGDCRVLLMYPSAKVPVLTIGKWHKFDGCLYSNTNYYDPTKPVYNYSSKYYYGYYDDYDDYYFRDKSYRQRKKYENNNRINHTEDRFGRNIHELAWPNTNENWIVCKDKKRYDLLASQAKLLEDDDATGLQLVNFTYNADELWYADPYSLQIFRDYKIDEYMEVLELEQQYQEFGAELDDDYLSFTGSDEMELWLNQATKTSCPYEVIWARKKWMVDTIMLEAFTMDGIKDEYKEGAWGHAAKYLREEGTLFNHNLDAHRRVQQDIIDKDELDELFPDNDQKALVEAHTPTKEYSGA